MSLERRARKIKETLEAKKKRFKSCHFHLGLLDFDVDVSMLVPFKTDLMGSSSSDTD